MRITKTYNGLTIPDTITKKKKVAIKIELPDGGITPGKTKSGNSIFVEGETEQKRKRALQYFLKVYNNDFSTEEQKKNGNLLYELKSKVGKSNTFASSSLGIPDKTDKLKYHISGRKIYILTFSDRSANMESAITHELVHVRKFANNQLGNTNHNEKKIDFETVGRISKAGLKQDISWNTPWTGTYFNVNNRVNKKTHSGNKELGKLKLSSEEKIKISIGGIIHDRKILTGSINTNITGKTASMRAEKLFPQSFLNQKIINTNSKK